MYLNWSDILTVLIPTSSALSTASDANGLSISQQPSTERHEGAACPICLSPPTAPRMTKCGHVFCYPCILHYLTLHEAASGASTPNVYHQHVPGSARSSALLSINTSTNSPPKWKRCPICWDAIYAKDLKAVQWWHARTRVEEYERNVDAKAAKENHLCMRLIERPHLTTLALPQSSTWPNATTSTLEQPLIAQHSAPWHFQPDVMTFCKFMLATPDQLLESLNGNLDELKKEKSLLQSFGMKDEVGLFFVDLAAEKVHEQMEKVMNELDTTGVQSRIGYAKNELKEHADVEKGIRERNEEAISKREKKRREREKKAESEAEDGGNEAIADFLQVQSDKQGVGKVAKANTFDEDAHRRKGAGPNLPKPRRNLNPPAPLSSSYLFYQASSGQNVFLHPLDIKVLLSIFGSYSAFPRTLQVPVQGADEGSMNEEIQKKCKYLNHLTKGTDIVFIEVDWDGLVREGETQEGAIKVDRSVLRMYDQALKQRRNRRNDRERREDRAKSKWEETQKSNGGRHIGMVAGGRRSLEETRSPTLSATEDLFPSSLGSTSTPSPSFRQAALFGSEHVYPMHSGPVAVEDDFPATTQERGIRRDEMTAPAAAPRDIQSSNAARRTVWGTPAARTGSFATALHNSSRNGEIADEDAPDWDSWLELEEDYIVGARNGTSVREGRGLNRQAKKGAAGDSSSDGTKPDDRQSVPGAPSLPKMNAKQQKKKTLVLTSGGGGRRR